MVRLRYWVGLLLLLLLLLMAALVVLGGCDQGAQPATLLPPQPTPTIETVVTPTPVAELPTSSVKGEGKVVAVATSVGTFVVPIEALTPAAKPVFLSGVMAAGTPNIGHEVADYFNNLYEARTLQPGGGFDIERVRGLTDEPYRDYTITLLQKDADQASAGKLVEVSYSGLNSKVDEWQPGENGNGTATVTLTRTKHETHKGAGPTANTATLRFKLERRALQGGVSWVAVDFFDAVGGKWISESAPPPPQDIAAELDTFFNQFYMARSLTPGGKFDIEKTKEITAFAYQDYTVPLLQRQQEEADAGKITSVSYSDIKTEVVSWFPQATSHGGIATVKVTRTSNVVRPMGAEPPQTATYQFRAHRHWDESEHGLWIVVDFLSPITNKWVSESAGLSGPVPPSGHG